MNSNYFSRVIILDSIPIGEENTAKNLYDKLQTLAAQYASTPAIEYLRIESAERLLEFFSQCRNEVMQGGEVPMLHIECHGDEDGFGLADGSVLDWPDLKLPLAELNVVTKLNLMISVAACTGGSLAKVITMGDRAPFWGLIGPTRTIYPYELEKAFLALFTTLFETKSPTKAVASMDATSTPGTFWRTTAQGLFEKGWNMYKASYCSPHALDERSQRMLVRLKKLHPPPYPTVDELKTKLTDMERVVYKRYVTTFFMQDLFVEHNQRFPHSLVI